MARQLFSPWGRFTKSVPTAGKEFIVIPSGTATYADILEMFPPDEDGDPRVFTTLADAAAELVSGRGDTIYIYPGAYTISTTVTIDEDDVKIIGVGKPGAAVLTGSAAVPLTLTGDDGELANFRIVAASANDGINMTGADRWHIHDLILEGAGGSTSRLIEMLTTACNENLIERCYFFSNLNTSSGTATQTAHITGLGSRNIIQHCTFQSHRTSTSNAGATTDAVVFAAAADIGNILRHNTVFESNGATFTEGFDYGTSALDFIVHSNNFLLATAGNAIVNGSNSAGFSNNIANGTV